MKTPKSFSLITVLIVLLGYTQLAQAFYDPNTGSFLSRDPIEERGGENLYGFVRNDGVNKCDLLGMQGWTQTSDVTLSTGNYFENELEGVCGGFRRGVKWVVTTSKSGWDKGLVIQWITWSGSVTIGDVTTPVKLNFTEYFDYPKKNVDEFSYPAMGNKTSGELIVRGEARYWAMANLEGSTTPVSTSGGLPTTPGNAFEQAKNNPLLSNVIIRSYKIKWDCSCPEKYDSATKVTKL